MEYKQRKVAYLFLNNSLMHNLYLYTDDFI